MTLTLKDGALAVKQDIAGGQFTRTAPARRRPAVGLSCSGEHTAGFQQAFIPPGSESADATNRSAGALP